jgi:hypothetical protein
MARQVQDLLRTSGSFAGAIRDKRLGAEVAIIQRLAEDLTARLLTRDPLSERVHHNSPEAAWLGLRAIFGHFAKRRRA